MDKLALLKEKAPLVVVFLGVFLLVVGMISQKPSVDRSGVVVESEGTSPIASGSGRLNREIVVDISGAVIKPGVYVLPENSRTMDALISAGGMAVNADRIYVSKTINLAQKISDGTKIYIPAVGEVSVSGKVSSININTAIRAELEELPGIGSVLAGKVMANRPYQNIAELVDRKILSRSVFEKIKDRISTY